MVEELTAHLPQMHSLAGTPPSQPKAAAAQLRAWSALVRRRAMRHRVGMLQPATRALEEVGSQPHPDCTVLVCDHTRHGSAKSFITARITTAARL